MKTNALLGLVVLVLLGCGLGWKLRTPRVAAQVVTPPPLAVQQTMSPETQKLLAPVNTSRFAGLPSAPELPLLSRPLQPGDVAPDFELQDQNGVTHHLWDSRGKTVVLSFYPKDQTQSCVSSAVSLSRAKPIFEAQDTVVYGVSVQPVASKKAFANRFGIQGAAFSKRQRTAAL